MDQNHKCVVIRFNNKEVFQISHLREHYHVYRTLWFRVLLLLKNVLSLTTSSMIIIRRHMQADNLTSVWSYF
jgi:hypothetical protein